MKKNGGDERVMRTGRRKETSSRLGNLEIRREEMEGSGVDGGNEDKQRVLRPRHGMKREKMKTKRGKPMKIKLNNK